jgi:8-amino-7-oxononanoate synthase
MSAFKAELDGLRSAGMFRSARVVEPLSGARLRVDGRELVNFAGNDYLGLRRHPDVLAGAKRAMDAYGLGAGASRLLAGTTPIHAELERALAEFLGFERALVFASGYQANVGVLSSLAGEGDVLILDALCHASLIDAGRLSKARMRVYPHADVARLEKLLATHADYRRRFVVTEGVFSMDGDLAPLAEVVALAERYDAWLVLDDAHAFGVLGETGRGTAERLGVRLPARTVFVATLSKALGSQGGFVAASGEAVDLLVNRARSFIYTTGLSPACAGGALAALEFVREPSRRTRLHALAADARRRLKAAGANIPDGETPIIPVLVGEVEATLKLSERLFDAGLFAPAIRPPTVPKGAARLRLSLSADHTPDDVARLASALKDALSGG